MKRKAFVSSLLVGIAAATLAWPVHAQRTVLNVYTALESDQLRAYQEAFNARHPDIEIRWTRASTGVITARLLAERAQPVADVIMGVAASSMVVFEREGMLHPYAPANLAAINPRFRDPAATPSWVGMNVWGAAICYNTAEATRLGLPRIESWQDLLRPEFRGRIVMPNPNTSGTGFLNVTAWLQMFGERGGWEFMTRLHENVAMYTTGGSRPCTMAGAGEFPVGISFEFRANNVRERGAPIEVIFPREGLGWDLESFAIVRGTPRLEAAKRLADWASTREANELYARNFAITAIPGIATRLKYIPADFEQRLVRNDFTWMAQHRDAVLAEWQRRFSAKAEPAPRN